MTPHDSTDVGYLSQVHTQSAAFRNREFLEAAGKVEIRCTLAEGRKSVEVLETAVHQMASGGKTGSRLSRSSILPVS
jgi:hypothetical protein